MLALGTSLHLQAIAQRAAVQPRHGEHVRDTLARAFGLTGPQPLRVSPPAGTAAHGHIVLCPDTTVAYKRWPDERWEALALELRRRGRRCTLAPTESSLLVLTRLLAGAPLVVAVDSGPLHLADALGVPVIGLYAATSSLTYGPYTQRERCLDHHRAASDALGFTPYDSSRHLPKGLAMHRIAVSEVLERIDAHA